MSAKEENRLPNLVYIMVDDLGYGDLGCYGSTQHRTPVIDQLAAEGARLTDFYVSAVCTPTRTAFLTGRHPARERLFEVLWPTSEGGLDPSAVTIAEWLSEYGYKSHCIGKWHVGHMEEEQLPLGQGFDEWYGIPYPNDMGPGHPQEGFRNESWPPIPMYRGTEVVEAPIDNDLLTQQFTAEAVRFIAENHHRPFFLFLSHAMPHTILGASPDFKGRTENGLFGDSVEELDWGVGEVLRALRVFGLEENTLVVFVSDNGASMRPWKKVEGIEWGLGSNGELRSGKMYSFEGGIRVPAIYRWPGVIPEGQVIDTAVNILDTIPTFAEMAGIESLDSAIDGVSIGPVLRGESHDLDDRPIFVGSGRIDAVRKGKWKYMVSSEPTWKSDIEWEPLLFDLSQDIGEKQNLVSEKPEVAKEMKAILDAFQAEVDADYEARN
ncbi:sulfatase [Pelagicoccus mobilis]|uniref:Sulfatase n=1 Tax=Pelagicoccus mobilis TaxID=415221 RepID=A0A934RZX0_9BACT|nr:sulfatase [Pelagicoccus mobilis]